MKRIIILIKRYIKKTLRIIKLPWIMLHQFYFRIAGNAIECNLCHYKANKFASDCWHLYCSCPVCSSDIRQRLLVASLTYLDDFSFDKIIYNKRILHFAPEKSLVKLLKPMAKEYLTADFLTEGYFYDNIDYNIDISAMDSIQDETFDCVIACDVLEHVPNHIGGINEVFRVLKKGGYCVFTVPQKDNLQFTYEDLSITDKKERERLFGQSDHVRIYGDDFITFLQAAGFDAVAVNESFFDKKIVDYHVLFPPILSKHPLATNYKKVFFGKKV
jgi:SAM-dependent methyltransferase